jgi:hypothetical protein
MAAVAADLGVGRCTAAHTGCGLQSALSSVGRSCVDRTVQVERDLIRYGYSLAIFGEERVIEWGGMSPSGKSGKGEILPHRGGAGPKE